MNSKNKYNPVFLHLYCNLYPTYNHFTKLVFCILISYILAFPKLIFSAIL